MKTTKTSLEEVRKTIEPLGYYVVNYREFKKASHLTYTIRGLRCTLSFRCHVSELTLEEALQGILLDRELVKLRMNPLPKKREVVGVE